jgi:hypothetical protein
LDYSFKEGDSLGRNMGRYRARTRQRERDREERDKGERERVSIYYVQYLFIQIPCCNEIL